jgi:pilus assembly protein CpaD
MTRTRPIERHRTSLVVGVLVGIAVALSACTHDREVVTATVPDDYRLRHPIAVEEANHSIVIFVGHARGGLSPSQRADVIGLARAWRREGTGAVVADVPVDTVNARAAAATFRDIEGVLVAGGVPPHGIKLHNYRPDDPQILPTIRLSYSKITAVAGPCGLWPEDLGPSIMDPDYNQNRSYQNFGCATQRNLAAMVDNPADLEQPRSEIPADTARRAAAFAKYRKGEPTTTTYPEADKAKLSDTGK